MPNLEAEGWDLLHDSFKCCGVNTYQDWTNTTIMGDESNFSDYVTVSCEFIFVAALHTKPFRAMDGTGRRQSTRRRHRVALIKLRKETVDGRTRIQMVPSTRRDASKR